MTDLRVLKAADLAAVPWKNGGGVTREIAAWPESAGIDDFAWRVSLADVAVDGPFSAFPGVDRTLTVVEGAGMELTVGGRQHLVDVRDTPHRFPGDVPTEGRLLDGPVVNLNVMHRRDRGGMAVLVSVVRGGLPLLVPAGSTVLVVALDAPARLVSECVTLDRYDVAVATGWPGILETEGRAAVITIRCP
ncbi:HutD family protein [Streptomyces sp. 21So2-11]|uniref:HutD/Ves family protein n=1 Tax=Streptomyces sp. 21So2-11 TaxID=3144408 RepID=UPI00321A06B0